MMMWRPPPEGAAATDDNNDSTSWMQQRSQNPSHQRHPFILALERFNADTPFVTRCLVYLQWFTYLLSWLTPSTTSLHLALSNYPEFTLGHYELYRLYTCILVNDRFSDLIFIYVLVVPPAITLERALGSARFAYFSTALLLASNLLFVTLWVLVRALVVMGGGWTSQSTSSLWIVGFGIMSMEAMISDGGGGGGSDPDDGDGDDASANPHKYRKVCFWTVRTRYAPLVLYGLTGLLSLYFDVGCFVSLLLGYAVGHQHRHGSAASNDSNRSSGLSKVTALLDRVLVSGPSMSYLQHCEEAGCLSTVVNVSRSSSRFSGGAWISVPMATGIRAWNSGSSRSTAAGGESSESMLPLFQMPARRAAASAAPGGSGGGRVLGGGGGGAAGSSPTTRSTPDVARAARLQALDRAAAASKKSTAAPSDAA